MDTRKFADWLQIIGNLGIFIGLFFVGFQLYQDRQLKRAELTAGYFENRILANIAGMGENPQVSIVKAATDPDAMTPEDAYVYFLNLDNWSSLWMRSARLEDQGLFTGEWQLATGMIMDQQTPMGIRYLERFFSGPNQLLPEQFVSKIQQQMTEPERALGLQRRLDYLLGRTETPPP